MAEPIVDVEAELAICQGGNGDSTHAHKEEMGRFLRKGEKILEQFSASIKSFEIKSKSLDKLEKTVEKLHQHQFGQSDDEPSQNKRRKMTLPGQSEARPCTQNDEDEIEQEIEDQDEEESDEVDQILNPHDENQEEDLVEPGLLQDLDDFFEAETKCGETIQNTVASTVNRQLRGQNDKERTKLLFQKYKRPENVEALQIPKIDGFLWDQLKNSTKSADYSRQRLIGQANQGLVPIIRAMDHIHNNPQPDVKVLTRYIADTFKIMATQINTNNFHRRETLKKDFTPKFKKVCDIDHPISNTNLFGDNLVEEVKALDTSKSVKMTTKASHPSPSSSFLGKRGGERSYYPSQQGQAQQNYQPQMMYQHQKQNSTYSGPGVKHTQYQPPMGKQNQKNYGQKSANSNSQNFGKKWGRKQ